MVPELLTVNLVTPAAEAVRRSPPPVPLIARTALLPMLLLIKSGNSVVALVAPIRTCESKSPVNTRFPVPLGVRVRSLLLRDPMIGALDDVPRLRVVDAMLRVAAGVIVARFAAVIVARFAALRVVVESATVAAVVIVARPDAVRVVAPESVNVAPDVMVFPFSDRLPVPRSSVPTFEMFFVAAVIF